jgi:hypothetical protein
MEHEQFIITLLFDKEARYKIDQSTYISDCPFYIYI